MLFCNPNFDLVLSPAPGPTGQFQDGVPPPSPGGPRLPPYPGPPAMFPQGSVPGAPPGPGMDQPRPPFQSQGIPFQPSLYKLIFQFFFNFQYLYKLA